MSGKTHKGLNKRLKKSSRGKISHRSCGKSHLMSGITGRRSMRLRKWKRLSDGERKSWERQYGTTL